MEPKEVERKLRDFLSRELSDSHYQCVLVFTDGKAEQKNQQIMVAGVLVGNAHPATTPFAVFHGLMRALEMQVKGLLSGTYGSEMKPQEQHSQTDYYR